MGNNPFFSIVVPVYNVSKYLKRCIDSILSQSYGNFELLLVDDGSTDDSGVICDEYLVKDNRIKVFHKKNGGVSSARNKGIDEARGKYIVFVDSDDYILADRLLQIFKLSDNNPDFIVEYYAAPENNKYNCKQIDIQDFYIIRDVGVIWTSAFKAKVLKDNKVYFDEKIWHGEDSLFVLDFFYRCSTIIFADEYGYIYEKGHEEGLNVKFQDWEKELYVYKKITGVSQKILDKLSNGNGEILCMSFGQILRIIKAMYKSDNILKYHDRKTNLKLVRSENYNKDHLINKKLNSNNLIYVLFKYKLYFLLDSFMRYVWAVRN